LTPLMELIRNKDLFSACVGSVMPTEREKGEVSFRQSSSLTLAWGKGNDTSEGANRKRAPHQNLRATDTEDEGGTTGKSSRARRCGVGDEETG